MMVRTCLVLVVSGVVVEELRTWQMRVEAMARLTPLTHKAVVVLLAVGPLGQQRLPVRTCGLSTRSVGEEGAVEVVVRLHGVDVVVILGLRGE